jgi:hypothetical protein
MEATTRVFDGAADRHAVLLPGRGYTTDMPLLWYVGTALGFRGWTVHAVTWSTDNFNDVPQIATEVIQGVSMPADGRLLIIGKSMGTLAMPLTAGLGLPGIWLTPVLTWPEIATVVTDLGPEHLLIGGTADSTWDSSVAARSSAQVLEIADADHALQVPSDLNATLDAIRTTTLAMDHFVARL